MRRFRIITVSLVAVVAAATFVAIAAALNIKDTPPPAGQVGVPYTFRFEMEPGSGTAPMTFKISSGGLPPGLSLVNFGERFSEVQGTPTQAGTWTFYLQAIDSPVFTSGGSPCCTEEQYSITINTKMIVATNSLPDANITQPYNTTLGVSGGTVSSWAVTEGALPDGLALNAATGVISGTPTKAGPFSFRVKATGTPNDDDKLLSIFVIAPLVLGGPTGQVYPAEPVTLSWKVNQVVNWGVRANGGRSPYTYTSTTLPVGLTLNPDGVLTGASTVAAATPVTFTVTDSAGVTDTLKTTITIKALLAFGTAKPPTGKLGKSFRWKLPVTGASKVKQFVASGKYPPGLELDEATGILSGIPLKAGSYKVKFWVIGDPGTQVFKSYTVKINP
jgi:large repetitive protein